MRSAEAPTRTLVSRLGWVTAATAGAAAVVATLAAMAVADRLITDQLERRADGVARTLARELADEAVLDEEVRDETAEVPSRGMTVAVWRGDDSVAGDPSLSAPATEGCRGVDGALTCRRDAGDTGLTVVVAAPASVVGSHRTPFAVAGASVLAVVLLGAGLAGRLVARRSLAPLSVLAASVSRADLGSAPERWLPPRRGLAEIDALRDALEELVDRLRAEVERAHNFAASAAHELRTPLAKIAAELELLAETDLAPSQRADVEAAHRTAVSLASLTERLLMLATPGAVVETTHGASVAQLLEDLQRELPDGDAARVRLHLSEDADAVVPGDPILLRALLDNAIGNGLTHTTGPIDVRVEEQPDRVVVDVDDAGPGVPVERREALFEAFERQPEARARSGHGLGLPLIRHIARVHGGDAELLEGPTGGRLRVVLPTGGGGRA